MLVEPVGELLTSKSVDQVVKIAAVTCSAVSRRRSPEKLQDEFVRQVRLERIKQAQEEEKWIANLKEFRIGDITDWSSEESKLCARIASEYVVEESGLLFFVALDQWKIHTVAWSWFVWWYQNYCSKISYITTIPV